jgi:hypothetical protein
MAIIKVITPSVTDANITTAKVTDNAITLAKMASGTDGNIISYDASGNPVAIATGSDGQILTSTGAGSPPAFEAAPGGGKIGQVVSVTKTDTFTGTSTSMADITGMSVAITPSATNSKVLVMFAVTIGNSADNRSQIKLLRGSTAIFIGDAADSRERVSGYGYGQADASSIGHFNGCQFLDSPSSTSAVTYKLQYKTNAGTFSFNRTGSDTNHAYMPRLASSITVMEVLA